MLAVHNVTVNHLRETIKRHWKNSVKINVSVIDINCRGAAKEFCSGGPVTDVVRFQTLAILHKDHFDVTGQFLVYYNRMWRQISSTSRHR